MKATAFGVNLIQTITFSQLMKELFGKINEWKTV